jgi:RNA polymerase sigma factor (sigma-70 family)
MTTDQKRSQRVRKTLQDRQKGGCLLHLKKRIKGNRGARSPALTASEKCEETEECENPGKEVHGDWCQRIAAGDMNAFWNIWLHYQDMLKERCVGWTSSAADAEDALSIASLRCYEKLPQVAAEIRNIEAWLTTVIHNICMDIHRGYRRESALALEAPPAMSALQKLEREELHGRLSQGIAALPKPLRAVIELRLRGWIYQEISVQLGISIETAYKRNSRARILLREMLLEEIPAQRVDPRCHSSRRMESELRAELKTLHRVRDCNNEDQSIS